MSSLCRSIISTGVDGAVVDIECHLSNNLPLMVIVGSAGRAVSEARDRLRGAFASSQLRMARKRITINLAPADLPKSDSGLDIAIAIAILVADQQIMPLERGQAAIGELGLDGGVRPVRGIIGKLLAGRRHGITEFFIPLANVSQAKLIPQVTLYPVASLRQLYDHLAGTRVIRAIATVDGLYDAPANPAATYPDLSEIVGQTTAKRALAIAAAGGHNLLLSGPPGTGKTMLAKALPSLLPPLGHEEIVEVTHLASLASHDYEQVARHRPVRSPHHSASHIAMIGGLGPGEISLSHRGVLLLDEFPEFGRPILEALRQPLEDRLISVARAKITMTYPAHFILVATANPCPCGYAGSLTKQCVCSRAQLQHYRGKLSGPILDRIDLCCNVDEVHHEQLLDEPAVSADDTTLQSQISRAHHRQIERYGSKVLRNSDLSNQQIRRLARLSRSGTAMLNEAAQRLQLSARAYVRVARVARTIADLDDCPTVESPHLSEALQYRQRPLAASS